MIEILSEMSASPRVEEVLAGRCDERDIGRLAPRAAEPSD
jgi:hypothetical protein